MHGHTWHLVFPAPFAAVGRGLNQTAPFPHSAPARPRRRESGQVTFQPAGKLRGACGFVQLPCHGCTHGWPAHVKPSTPFCHRVKGRVPKHLQARGRSSAAQLQGGLWWCWHPLGSTSPDAASGGTPGGAAHLLRLPAASVCSCLDFPTCPHSDLSFGALIPLSSRPAKQPLTPTPGRAHSCLSIPPARRPAASPHSLRQESRHRGVQIKQKKPVNVACDSYVQRGCGLSANEGTRRCTARLYETKRFCLE